MSCRLPLCVSVLCLLVGMGTLCEEYAQLVFVVTYRRMTSVSRQVCGTDVTAVTRLPACKTFFADSRAWHQTIQTNTHCHK